MPGPFTRAQLRTRVQREVQDEAGTYATATVVNDLLNEAQQQFAEQSRCLRSTTVIDVVSGTAEVTLTAVAPRVLEVLRVALPSTSGGTDERELVYLSQEDIEREYWDWRNMSGQPYAYMRWGQGFDKIRLFPTPDSGFTSIVDPADATINALYGGIDTITGLTDAEFDSLYGDVDTVSPVYGALRVDYVAAPTSMDSDDDEPSIPAQYHEALIWYAVARFMQMDVPIAQQAKAQGYMAQYAEELARATSLTNSQFQKKPVRNTVLRRF